MAVKKQRLHILTGELTKHAKEYNQGLIGQKIRVLVTGADRKEGYLSGYTEGRIVVRFPSTDLSLIGTFADPSCYLILTLRDRGRTHRSTFICQAMKRKVAFKTLGCRLNQFETDALLTDFFNAGYEVVDFKEDADVYIINTCTVTSQGDHKSNTVY